MYLEASKTIEAAGNYDAGDILSESDTNGAGTAWEFTPKSAGSMTLLERNSVITAAELTCTEDSITNRFRLHLFKGNPSNSELDDNAAKNFVIADIEEEVGHIDFPAMVDKGTYSSAFAPCYVPWQQDSKEDSLYGVLETLNAETNESASMVIEIKLFIEESRG